MRLNEAIETLICEIERLIRYDFCLNREEESSLCYD